LKFYGVYWTLKNDFLPTYLHFFILFFYYFIPDAERSFRSDCDTDDGISISTANENDYMNGSQHMVTNRSPLTLRQSSPFPNEMTNRRAQFNAAQERIRNGEFS
jgi:hypothetical protein